MTQEITYGRLVDRIVEGAEGYDEYCSGKYYSPFKNYSLAGRKIHYLEVIGAIGASAGILGIAVILSGIINCTLIGIGEWSFPHNIAAALGGTSAGLIVVGFAIAAVTYYLSKKEHDRVIYSDEIKGILERENAYNKHPQVLRNITALLDEYEIELEAPSQHTPLLQTPAREWEKDPEVVL